MVISHAYFTPSPALALVLAAVPAAAQNAAPAAPAASAAPAVNWNDTQWILYGRQITEWFFAGQTDSILAHSSPDVLDRMGGAKGLLEARDELLARVGSETKVISDKMTKRKGNPQYWRESEYENGPNRSCSASSSMPRPRSSASAWARSARRRRPTRRTHR